MKRQFNFFTLAAAFVAMLSLAVLPACSDGESGEETPALVLTASTTSYVLGEDNAPITFKAMLDGKDVTASAEITNLSDNSKVEGASWTPTAKGSFKFQATYEGEVSNEVTVTVRDKTDPEPSTGTFYRYILLTKFGYTSCGACAEVERLFKGLSPEDAEHFVVVYAHFSDRLTIAEGTALKNLLYSQFGNIEPKLAPVWFYNYFNVMVGTSTDDGFPPITQAGIVNQISRAERTFPTVLGIIAESTVEGTTAKVSATVKFQEAGDYKIACVLTEDNVPGGGSGEVLSTFPHVLRAVATDMLGEEISPAVSEPGERTFDFSVELNSEWNKDECSFAIYVFKNEGEKGYIVNNALACPVGGAITEYRYAE